jgi:HAD superfamily hydrolase (TIGR01509 family)
MTSSLPFDAVLFDCDGVLVDSEPITNGVLRDMLEERGWALTPEECMRIFVGKAVKDERALIEAKTGTPVTDDWLQSFWARRNVALDRDLVEIPGAPAAARALHATLNGRIACASGADRKKVELQLQKIGLFDAFDGRIFSGHETPRSKPYPDVYLAAAAALDVDPARCAVVEDTVTGATAGVAAGATVFGYSPGGLGHSGAEALRGAGVAQIFTDMAQLPAVLAAWGGRVLSAAVLSSRPCGWTRRLATPPAAPPPRAAMCAPPWPRDRPCARRWRSR